MASPSTNINDLASEHTFRVSCNMMKRDTLTRLTKHESLTNFSSFEQIVIWFGLGLCIITFALRLAIRIICCKPLVPHPSIFPAHLSSIPPPVQALRADIWSFEMYLPGTDRKTIRDSPPLHLRPACLQYFRQLILISQSDVCSPKII